jgi:N,N'-diacetyllegionaminate synthase
MKCGIKEFSFLEMDPPVVIAEVGVNHNGDPGMARQLVDVAVECRVDIVKFQAFKSEKEISRYAKKAPYQLETTSDQGNQLEMCKALELSIENIIALKEYCNKKHVGFLCTAFESDSLEDLINRVGVTTIKVPSGEITNIPFLEQIGALCDGVILSTGASTLKETGGAIEAINRGGCDDLVLLHCVTSYPADVQDVNLRAMKVMRDSFGYPVGYSDHTQGTAVSIAAAALGAVAIEKHFTLDQNLPGPDHRASIEPHELRALVQGVRDAHHSLGNGIKKPQTCELPNIALIRKSLVASRHLKAGERISRDMIEIKRPESGIIPGDLPNILNLRLTQDVEEDAPIRWEHFQ